MVVNRRTAIKVLFLGGVGAAVAGKLLDDELRLRACLVESEKILKRMVGGRSLSPYEEHQVQQMCQGKERR